MEHVAPRHDGRRPGGRAGVRLLIGDAPSLGPGIAVRDRFRQPGPVVFWANYGDALRGPTCSLYGSARGGLLARCGYSTARESAAERRKKLPQFLKDMDDIVGVLGVDVYFRHFWHGYHLSLEDMRRWAEVDSGVDSLPEFQAMIGTSEDYLWRWNRYFAECDGYPSPTRENTCYVTTGGAQVEDLFVRLEYLGITQRQLAVVLDVSPSHLAPLTYPFCSQFSQSIGQSWHGKDERCRQPGTWNTMFCAVHD
jgi:hypothetical protein